MARDSELDIQAAREMNEQYIGQPQARRIADLERQLAEAQQWLAAFGHVLVKYRIVRVPEDLEAKLDAVEGAEALAKRKCLFATRQGVECPGYWAEKEDYCGPCYARAAIDAAPAREKGR